MIVTIDGPTASGKSTVARLLAEQLGYTYINSGLLFRAVGYILNKKSLPPATKEAHHEIVALFGPETTLRYTYTPESGAQVWYNAENITPHLKSSHVDSLASKVALEPLVREAILEFQRNLACKENIVAEGRDCGTAVFPSAQYKFYITASLEVRAQRWQSAQARRGKEYSLKESIQIINERDTRDSERSLAPLTIPEGALVIDTSNMSIDDVVAECLSHIKA